MAKPKDAKFTVANKSFSAYGILAIVPTADGCTVRWSNGKEETFTNVTSQELLFKIDEAKLSTDSH